jgi:hypothetical protein
VNNKCKTISIIFLVFINFCLFNSSIIAGENSLSSFSKRASLVKCLEEKIPIYIKLTIYIESLTFVYHDGKKESFLCQDPEKIAQSLAIVAKKFEFINLNFIVDRICILKTEIECNNEEERDIKFVDFISSKCFDGMDREMVSISEKNKESINLFFCFVIDCNILGLSSHPYLMPGSFVFISTIKENDITLTHEMGHYFGLLHTFNKGGDMCDDTVDGHLDYDLLGTDADPNKFNIMTYTKDDNCIEKLFFSENQKDLVVANLFFPSRLCQILFSYSDNNIIGKDWQFNLNILLKMIEK